MDNFDLRKYLVENKVTTNSRTNITENFKPAREYLKLAAKEYYGLDLDDPEDAETAQDMDLSPIDIVQWIGEHDPQVGQIRESDLQGVSKTDGYLAENNLTMEEIAEYQFDAESYDFSTMRGALEFESSIVISQAFDPEGKPQKVQGYDYIVSTDRGPIGDMYYLVNLEYVKFFKSIADIYDADTGWYAGYKGRTKNK